MAESKPTVIRVDNRPVIRHHTVNSFIPFFLLGCSGGESGGDSIGPWYMFWWISITSGIPSTVTDTCVIGVTISSSSDVPNILAKNIKKNDVYHSNTTSKGECTWNGFLAEIFCRKSATNHVYFAADFLPVSLSMSFLSSSLAKCNCWQTPQNTKCVCEVAATSIN